MLVRFDNGAKGAFSVGQVCAGHKNDVVLEVCGSKASLKWRQEHQNELWFGHRDQPNQILQKDPALMDAEVRGYAHLPGGHQEAWADAFCNLMRDIYGFIAAGKKPSDAASAGLRHLRGRLPRQRDRRSHPRQREERQRLDEGRVLTLEAHRRTGAEAQRKIACRVFSEP